MKIARFSHNNSISYGIIEGDVIIKLLGTPFESLQLLKESVPVEQVKFLNPVTPSKAVCVGLNYADHAQEMGLALPKDPVIFIKPSNTIIGPDEPINYPSMSHRVDYEGELALVVGKKATCVPFGETDSYILGYTCANDVTARDLQPKDGQWTIAKGFDTFLPIGPIISDEIDPTQSTINTTLNGVLKQQSNTKNLIFSASFLLSYLSHIMTLYPGDIILTGTPSGVGPMHKGDVVEVTIQGIGTLRNTLL